MLEMLVTYDLLAITAVYQHGCWCLKMALHGDLSFVDAVSDSDACGSCVSNFGSLTIVN